MNRVPCELCGVPQPRSWLENTNTALGKDKLLCESCLALPESERANFVIGLGPSPRFLLALNTKLDLLLRKQ